MQASAESIFTRMSALVAANLPRGITPTYYQAFVRRNRAQLVSILDRQLRARGTRPRPTGYPSCTQSPAIPDVSDLWSSSKRAAANLDAMALAARRTPAEMNTADRAVLAAYSGWGGLSIQRVADRFMPFGGQPPIEEPDQRLVPPSAGAFGGWSGPHRSPGNAQSRHAHLLFVR